MLLIAHHRPSQRKSGFTLLEIIIAVSVIVILAGVLVVRSGGMLGKARTAETLSLINALKVACTSHHADTGNLAYEYGGYAASSRKLSGTQTDPGWNGPYIESDIPQGSSPFGGTVHLYKTVTANSWITGFDIDGDGTADVEGDGNMIYFSGVGEDEAEAIDGVLDTGMSGAWEDVGSVRYISSSKILLVLVYY